MAERNALAVMNHPFIIRLVYSFQVAHVWAWLIVGSEQPVLRNGAVSLRNALGSGEVRVFDSYYLKGHPTAGKRLRSFSRPFLHGGGFIRVQCYDD